MGIRTMVTGQGNISKNKGNERTGIRKWRNGICHISFYKGSARMRWLRAIAYWVRLGPSRVFAPSCYLCLSPSFPSQSPVVRILSAVTDAVLSDSKSIAWMGQPDVDAHRRQTHGDDRDGTGGIVEGMEWYQQRHRGCGMAAAVCSQRRTVSERASAYECGFQGQPYMGHYSGGWRKGGRKSQRCGWCQWGWLFDGLDDILRGTRYCRSSWCI
jgi:hypothetical protein